MGAEHPKLNTEQKIWKALAALLRSLRPVLLYLLLPALIAGIGMVISGRIHNSQRFIEQSGRFYKTVGLLATFALLEYRARKRGSSIIGETTLSLENPDYRKLAMLFGIGLGISLCLSAVFTLLPETFTEHYQVSSEMAFSGTDLWLAVLSALILAPVLEEIIFRGYMLNRLFEGFDEPWALGLCGVIFGLCHTSPLWILYAGFMGVFLARIAVKEDNILYSTAMHMGFNFLTLPTLAISRNEIAYQIFTGSGLITAAWGIIGFCLAGYLWKLYQMQDRK